MRAFLWAGTALALITLTVLADEKKEETPAPPPKGAKVLFDGKSLEGWVGRNGKETGWKVEDGYMEVAPGKGDIVSKEKYGPDFEMHVEFWLPNMPEAKGQARANSGVYLLGRWEIQVLDSYRNDTYDNGSVGALYGILAPDKEAQKKAVKPPENWNTYDITFKAPRADTTGKVTEKGEVTVKLNGIAIIDKGQFDKLTNGSIDQQISAPGPLLLQDHGNKVRFRNIWVKTVEK